jgi:hypothetical protein
LFLTIQGKDSPTTSEFCLTDIGKLLTHLLNCHSSAAMRLNLLTLMNLVEHRTIINEFAESGSAEPKRDDKSSLE